MILAFVMLGVGCCYVCLSVCMFVTRVIHAKMAEPSEMMFLDQTHVGPRTHTHTHTHNHSTAVYLGLLGW